MSAKPLAERLQLKGARTLALIDCPAGIETGIVGAAAPAANADVVLMFAADRGRLEDHFARTVPTLRRDAILWMAYPKLTSRLTRDLSRDIVHDLSSAHGLTAVSLIAVDGDWSAMRLKRA